MNKTKKKAASKSTKTIQDNLPSIKPSIRPRTNSYRTIFISTILWICSLILFVNFKVLQVTDGRFMLLLSHSIAFENTTRLDPYFVDHPNIKPRPGFFYWWWQLSPKKNQKVIHKHNQDWDGNDPLFYRYPNLPSFLSIPAVVVFNKLLDIKIVRNQKFSFADENLAHKFLSAILSATIVVEIFLLAKLLLPYTWSITLTIIIAYGSQIVSTLSRGVWSDTWALVIGLLAIYHLVAHSIGKTRLQPIYLAFLSTLVFFCKPNYASIGIMCVIYLGINAIFSSDSKKWQPFYWLVTGGMIGVIIFCSYSLYQFGTIIPDYFIPSFQIQYIPEALLGHSISPSRGLLVYSPFLVMIGYFLYYYRYNLKAKQLIVSSILPILMLVFVSSAWKTWWGGHSYGPRLLIPLLPFTIMLSVIAVHAFYQSRYSIEDQGKLISSRMKIENILIVITCSISMLINIHGAREPKTWFEWFYQPYPVFNNPNQRLWDWTDAQFLAGIKKRPFEKNIIK